MFVDHTSQMDITVISALRQMGEWALCISCRETDFEQSQFGFTVICTSCLLLEVAFVNTIINIRSLSNIVFFLKISFTLLLSSISCKRQLFTFRAISFTRY